MGAEWDGDDLEVLEVLRRTDTREPTRLHPIFKRHGVDTVLGVACLLKEIRQDGSNTIWLPFRPEGVHYRVVVEDVAKAIDARVEGTVVATELSIVARISELYYEQCSEAEREEFDKILSEVGADAAKGAAARASAKAVGAAILAAIAKFGAKFALKTILRRLPVIAVPGLGGLMAAWTVFDILGPAMRKTIPTVFELALLRMEFGDEDAGG